MFLKKKCVAVAAASFKVKCRRSVGPEGGSCSDDETFDLAHMGDW